jgi:hypothetical protein
MNKKGIKRKNKKGAHVLALNATRLLFLHVLEFENKKVNQGEKPSLRGRYFRLSRHCHLKSGETHLPPLLDSYRNINQ